MPEFVSHVPIWVGLVFLIVLYRGLAALQTRDVAPLRLLIVPAAFTAWSLAGLSHGDALTPSAYAGLAAGGVIGVGIGIVVARTSARAEFVEATGSLRIAGSPATLVLILASFMARFAVTAYGVTHADARGDLLFGFITFGLSGLTTGLFWGRFLAQVAGAIRHAGMDVNAASLGSVLGLAPRAAIGRSR